MTSFYDSYDYYKKMLELQEKLRKSEEERIRLEERFKILVQESRNRHDACINRLRLRYIDFLEEQRTEDKKNHKLLEALNRVDNGLALMTAKTDRLNVLKKQYETYLRRIYTVPSLSRSNIDGKNTASQDEDRYLRGNITVKQIPLSSEIKGASSLQTVHSNSQTTRSISPYTLKLTRPAESMYYEHCQRNVVNSLGVVNQQMNDQQNMSLQSYPLISQNGKLVRQLPIQNLSAQSFQQRPSYIQVDENFHALHASPGRTSSLSRQTQFVFNKPLSESAKTMTHPASPERIDGSTSQYKMLDVPQDRFAPMALRHYDHTSLSYEPFRCENNRTSWDDTEPRINVNKMSPVGSTIPVNKERNVPVISSSNKSINLSLRASPSHLNYSWRKFDRYKSNQKPVNDILAGSLATSKVDNMMRRHKRVAPGVLNGTRLSMPARQADVEDDERRTVANVENELDRYIDKIRKLHCDLDAQSLEEIDDVHGDGLDVALLGDKLGLPAERQLKENLPKEVEKVLALADDLVSRTVDFSTANDSKKLHADEDRNLGELVQSVQNDVALVSERDHTVFPRMHETSTALAKDSVNNDVMLVELKLDRRRNAEEAGEEKFSDIDNKLEYEYQSSKIQPDENVNFIAPPNDNVTGQRNAMNIVSGIVRRDEYKDNIYNAANSNVDQYSFDAVEELEPWNLDLLQKRIKEVDLNSETEDQINEKEVVSDASRLIEDDLEQIESISEIKTVKSEEVKGDLQEEDTNVIDAEFDNAKDELIPESTESLEQRKESTDKNETEINETYALQHQNVEYKDKSHMNNEIQNMELVRDQVDKQNELDNEQKEVCDEANIAFDADRNDGQAATIEDNDYNYYENADLAQNYEQNYDADYIASNEGYGYDENVPYESNQNENYDENASYEADQGENYDKGATYENDQNQDCQEYANQEYAQETNESYVDEQYVSEDQYEHVPADIQYQEDTSQQYAYSCDQQYNPDQVSDANAYQQFPHTTDYDPSQTQFIMGEDEQNEENKELQEELKYAQVEEEKMVDTDQSKHERLSVENGSKKKKDVIKSLLDSDTDSTIERNVSNTESDFDFN